MKKSISMLLVVMMIISVMVPMLSFAVTALDASAASENTAGVSYYDGTPTTDWYDDGSATEFKLNSASDLYGLAQLVNDGNTFSGKTVKLTTDVVINGGDVASLNYDTSSAYLWEPIGKNDTIKFSGTFDGDGHVISGLFISKINTDRVGLFGSAVNATVKNVILRNSYVASSTIGTECNLSQSIGSVVGYGYDLTLQNCYSDALLADGGMLTGGIIGYAIHASKIDGCVFAGEVRADGRGVGGICGGSDNGGLTITNCMNLGTITNYHRASTLTGFQDCHSGTGAFTGGIIGQLKNDADVTYSVNIGNVVSPNHNNCTGKPNGGTAYTTNAFNENTIAGIGEAATSTVDYCYVIEASDAVSGGKTPWIGHQYTATLGANNGYISSADAILGNAAKTAMTSLDWENDWSTVDGSFPMPAYLATKVAKITMDFTAINPDQPVGLGADHWNGGEVTPAWTIAPESDGKYHIRRASDFAFFATFVNDHAHYFAGETVVLDTDIVWNVGDASTWDADTTGLHPWVMIGNGGGTKTDGSNKGVGDWAISFQGTFDGQGHSISGIYHKVLAAHTNSVFGYLTNGAVVGNFAVLNSWFGTTGLCDGVSGAVGRMRDSRVHDIYSDAIIYNADWSAGGIIGYARTSTGKTTTIENCVYNGQFTGTVKTTTGGAGGIVGFHEGGNIGITIQNCINLATIGGAGNGVGGILGHSKVTLPIVKNCMDLGGNAVVGDFDTSDGTLNGNYYTGKAYNVLASAGNASANTQITADQAIGSDAVAPSGWVKTDYYPMPSVAVARMYIDSLVDVTHVQESDPVNGTYDVRFIASVSAEDWAGGNAGFEFDVSFDGEGTANDFENKTLTWYVSHGYKGINGKNQNGVVLEAVTATAGKYLIACTVKNVNAVGTVTFKVNAFVADAQGNRVDSEGYTVVYRNGSFVSGTKTNATVNYNLNGLPLSEYQIVYDADDAHAKTLAETLSTNLYARTGTRLAVVADTAAAGEHEIIVGETARNTSAYRGTTPIDTYAISSDGTHVVLTADYTKGLIEATEVFALRFASMARNVTVGSKEIHTCQKLSTMSFNVLYQDTSLSLAEDQATRWPAVVKMILNYMPDTVGMQETTTYWLEYLQADTEFTKYYTILEFKQRLTTGGKGATRELICFRKDRFTATETATKWLSETPDVENSYFTDASDPKHRILNYVKLKDKVTGEEIIHANTHLEHIKADVNLKQANVVLNILQQFEGYKVLLTGDFNANTSSNTYQTITGTDMWADSRSLADYTEGNGYTIPADNPTKTLDYCFVTDETISVNYHTVCNEKIVTDAYNGYASDHHPIFTVYGIKDMEITQQTMTLTSSNALIKTLGVRNLASDTQLNCDWSCSGLEFVINNQSSEITFHLGADNPCYFRAYVDGEAYKTADGSEHLEIKTGSEMLTLTGLPTGVHTIRLIKVTGYTLSRAQIYSMSFCGSLLTPPADNELFIEYVGDSISCGYGVLSENTNDGKYTAQDGSLGYPYRLAEALGADYTITALSGQGLLCGDPGVPKGYQYACPKKDSTNPYTFARKADLVIINIGTNDYYLSAGGGTPHLDITEADFQAAYEAFIAQVKAANGSDCKILCLYGMMNDTYEDGILAAVKASGGEQSGIYTLKMAKSTSGHPWATDHAAYTETLTAYVTNTILK